MHSSVPSNLHIQGKLDFQCYPERLLIKDVIPGMVNAVLMVRCDCFPSYTMSISDDNEDDSLGENSHSSFILHVSDDTGINFMHLELIIIV